MKKNIYLQVALMFLVAISLNACKDKVVEPCSESYMTLDESKVLNKICFGSCGSHLSEQVLLNTAAEQNPDLYIFLGDNIYADTYDMEVMQEKYDLLCAKQSFINLKKTAPFLAVWDDHDFGLNDAGAEYPKKEESKQIFMKFWDELDNKDRMSHLGIYDAKIIGENNKRVQIILLDNRTFRTELLGGNNTYIENTDPAATMLGAAQWAWLEEQLLKPAEIRIIASSNQFATEQNGYEAWANFPLEQEKMYNLIESTQANGVVFLSGDVHYSELSKRTPANTYPIYDLTSSGITGTSSISPNTYRIGNANNENNIGVVDIDWDGANTKIKFTILNKNENPLIEHEINLSELQL
ncbi:MAG: alkaline phosphatase D family protein [Chitinophagales bacterium]